MSDTLSFYVHDEVGSVIATVTENLGGANQSVTLTSYDAWGKARPTTGSNAYQDPAPGSFYSPTPAGQQEGFAGHDNLSDTGLVDMEGRVYDPEVGNFLSPDPNVQYPYSSQGYDRYIYVNDNPLSLSDPSGYWSEAGIGQVISDIGPFLSTIQPFCGVWCTAAAEAVGGYMQSGNNVGTGLEAGTLSLASSESMNAIGSYFGASPSGAYVGGMSAAEALASKTLVEGLVLGALSEAGGGRFGSGFLGGVTGSLVGSFLNSPAFNSLNDPGKIILAALAGGTVSYAAGGNFGNGALAAAFVEAFNDLQHYRNLEEAKRKLSSEKFAELVRLGMHQLPGEINLYRNMSLDNFALQDSTLWGTGSLGVAQYDLATARLGKITVISSLESLNVQFDYQWAYGVAYDYYTRDFPLEFTSSVFEAAGNLSMSGATALFGSYASFGSFMPANTGSNFYISCWSDVGCQIWFNPGK